MARKAELDAKRFGEVSQLSKQDAYVNVSLSMLIKKQRPVKPFDGSKA